MQQHRVPAHTLDQGANRGSVQPDDQVTFPVARYGPVGRFGRPLADLDFVGDEAPAGAAGPGAGLAQRPAGAQASGQLALERAASLDVERLVDRLVGDPHRLIIGGSPP